MVGDDDPLGGSTQYGRIDLNIDAAWQLAGGHALIGDLDTGLYEQHPALAQFSATGSYLGGNFVPVDSLDIGQASSFYPGPNLVFADVDEMDPIAVTDPNYCDPDGNGYALPGAAGHGTHVSGLMAANGEANLGVQGTCEHCAIAMMKVTRYPCAGSGAQTLSIELNPNAVGAGLQYLTELGANVVNMSLGGLTQQPDYCSGNSTDSWCLGLDEAVNRDVAVVAAAGNARTALQFPANDGRPISAGGFEESLAIWDDSPGSNTNCPASSPLYTECGSNLTPAAGGAR